MGGAGILGLVLLVALVVFVIVWTVKGFRKDPEMAEARRKVA